MLDIEYEVKVTNLQVEMMTFTQCSHGIIAMGVEERRSATLIIDSISQAHTNKIWL